MTLKVKYSHQGYELKEKDFKDVFAMCNKFGILLPTEYQECPGGC